MVEGFFALLRGASWLDVSAARAGEPLVQSFWFGHGRSGAFPYCDDESMQMTPGGRYLAGGVNQTARQASGDIEHHRAATVDRTATVRRRRSEQTNGTDCYLTCLGAKWHLRSYVATGSCKGRYISMGFGTGFGFVLCGVDS